MESAGAEFSLLLIIKGKRNERSRKELVREKEQHLIWKILSLTKRACSGEKAQSGSGEAIGKAGFLYFWEENCDHVFFLQEKERMTHSSSRGRDC